MPNPGDFFTSRMGAESVILARDKKKKVHVFLNSCRHRGMKVCQYDHGNTQLFTCPYHSWSYTTDGKLFGVPQYKNLYEGCMDKEEWSLIEVPNMEVYKGTVWASWDKDAPDFLTYLGDAKLHLDLALDHRDGREGGSEVLLGVHKWIIPCNWKFAAENFLGDTYHNVSHRSVDLIGIGPSAEAGLKGRRDMEMDRAKHLWVSFGAGHGVHSAIMPEDWEYVNTYQNNPVVAEYFRECHAKRKERLAMFDLTPAEIARLHGPIGLDLGGKSPAEIAVAIVAEIVAVKNGVALVQKKEGSALPESSGAAGVCGARS